MGKRLIIQKRAYNSIEKISKTIFDDGYPDRAKNFFNELIMFAYELKNIAKSFTKCRHKEFAKKNLKCIPYKKNYIIIFSVTNENDGG